jgi:hypothetical protein
MKYINWRIELAPRLLITIPTVFMLIFSYIVYHKKNPSLELYQKKRGGSMLEDLECNGC